MKVIIAGTRDITDYSMVVNGVRNSGYLIEEVVSGKARGPDTMGERWANQNNVPIKEFPADWNTHKKAAGPIRNAQMGKYADAAIILWDGKSSGTRHMIEVMRRLNKPVHIEMVAVPVERMPTIESFFNEE